MRRSACRLHVAAFLLRGLAAAQGLDHGRALAALVAGAQASGDARLLRNAHLQLAAMLRADLVHLGGRA